MRSLGAILGRSIGSCLRIKKPNSLQDERYNVGKSQLSHSLKHGHCHFDLV